VGNHRPLREANRLLCADMSRQLAMEGKIEKPTWVEFLKRSIHPRFLPLLLYRWSRAALLLGIPGLPFVFSYLNLIIFGIQITPRCDIGSGLFLPHPVGTVIGAWKIGRDATIFQGVTLGAKRVDLKFSRELLPEIGDGVTIGAGAKILGGIRVGDNTTIGANAVVLESIGSNCIAAGIPARIVSPSMNESSKA